MDNRQILLKAFCQEAALNLQSLQTLLPLQPRAEIPAEFAEAVAVLRELGAAAQLVAADSVAELCQRLESIFNKYLATHAAPTAVEMEAIELAVAWLSQLIGALCENQPEPKALIKEAHLALELAENFPGNARLVELIDSNAEVAFPHLDGPSSASGIEAELPELPVDPFAKDPDFGFGLKIQAARSSQLIEKRSKPSSHDPFAEDDELDPHLSLLGVEADLLNLAKPLPFDPFAEDDGCRPAREATSIMERDSHDDDQAELDPFADDPPVGDDF